MTVPVSHVASLPWCCVLPDKISWCSLFLLFLPCKTSVQWGWQGCLTPFSPKPCCSWLSAKFCQFCSSNNVIRLIVMVLGSSRVCGSGAVCGCLPLMMAGLTSNSPHWVCRLFIDIYPNAPYHAWCHRFCKMCLVAKNFAQDVFLSRMPAVHRHRIFEVIIVQISIM